MQLPFDHLLVTFDFLHPPLKLEGIEITPNLGRTEWWEGPERDLVNISTSCEAEGIYESEMRPERYCWRTKWQSNSTCFVRSWKSRFRAIWITDLLSERTGTGNNGVMDRSSKRRVSQVSSATTRLMDLYFTSVDDREIEAFFFDFQETGEPS